MAFAIGCDEFFSNEAESMISSFSDTSDTMMSSTSGLPSVMVPVLSKAATSI